MSLGVQRALQASISSHRSLVSESSAIGWTIPSPALIEPRVPTMSSDAIDGRALMLDARRPSRGRRDCSHVRRHCQKRRVAREGRRQARRVGAAMFGMRDTGTATSWASCPLPETALEQLSALLAGGRAPEEAISGRGWAASCAPQRLDGSPCSEPAGLALTSHTYRDRGGQRVPWPGTPVTSRDDQPEHQSKATQRRPSARDVA